MCPTIGENAIISSEVAETNFDFCTHLRKGKPSHFIMTGSLHPFQVICIFCRQRSTPLKLRKFGRTSPLKESLQSTLINTVLPALDPLFIELYTKFERNILCNLSVMKKFDDPFCWFCRIALTLIFVHFCAKPRPVPLMVPLRTSPQELRHILIWKHSSV